MVYISVIVKKLGRRGKIINIKYSKFKIYQVINIAIYAFTSFYIWLKQKHQTLLLCAKERTYIIQPDHFYKHIDFLSTKLVNIGISKIILSLGLHIILALFHVKVIQIPINLIFYVGQPSHILMFLTQACYYGHIE